MKIPFLLVSLMLSLSTRAQTNLHTDSTAQPYAPKALQEDFSVFRKTLEAVYPSLYRYTDSAAINAWLDKQFLLLNQPMDEASFYKIIVLACARFRDEHLIAKPSPGYYASSFFNEIRYFPFTFKIIQQRFYIVKTALHPSPIEPGAEIISINGRPVKAIMDSLLPAIPADGYISTFRLRHLEDYSRTQEQNMFDLFYPVFIEHASSFRLEYISRKGSSIKKTVLVDGLSNDAYRQFYREREVLDTPLTFRYINNATAYLKISSFLGWHRRIFKQNFDSLYAVIFNELRIKKIPHLILDLRNNEGGDNTGEELIAYLMKQPYRHLDYIERRYVGLPAVSNYLDNPEGLYVADSLFYKTANGNFRLKKEYYRSWTPLLLEQQPKDNFFEGQLTVLANGASGSMAGIVCSLLKSNHRAVFIGEETGGAMEGPTSRSFTRLTLPNTHISITVPLAKTVNAVTYKKGRGVVPDYSVEPSIDDLLNGVDTELNFALQLMRRR